MEAWRLGGLASSPGRSWALLGAPGRSPELSWVLLGAWGQFLFNFFQILEVNLFENCYQKGR